MEKDFGVVVLAFVLMDNHFHLVLRSDDARLSEAMQRLEGRYARGFNRRHGRVGALFQGRFDAGLVTSDDGLDRAAAYVHLNPLEAGMVTDPAAFPWSSLPSYARGKAQFEWLKLDLLAGRSAAEYVAVLASLDARAARIGESCCVQDLSWLRLGHADGVVEASRVFDTSDRIVASALGASVDEIYVPTAGRRNFPRLVGIVHAATTCGFPLRDVAARYGLRGPDGVHSARRRLRDLAAGDEHVAQRMEQMGLAA